MSAVDEVRDTLDSMLESPMIREESKESMSTHRGSEVTNRGSETSGGLNVTSLLLGESILLEH